jgi:uncharacterized protein (TIGR02391 family)
MSSTSPSSSASNAASKAVAPLQPEALEALAQVIGDFFTGSEITRLFSRAGYSSISHDGTTKWRFVADQFQQLQRRDISANGVLAVIKTAGSPQGWINRRGQFETFLGAVNQVFGFYGLRLLDDGKLIRTGTQATTVARTKSADEVEFDARAFHAAIRKHGRTHFCRGAYFHAVFECCKALDTALRDAIGSGKSGQPLMSEALSLSGPVKLNAQRTQSERDEQQGIMYLCMGLMNAVRNPQAHEPELHWPMSREDALDVLALVSFLFRKLEAAVVVQGSSVAKISM